MHVESAENIQAFKILTDIFPQLSGSDAAARADNPSYLQSCLNVSDLDDFIQCAIK